jgi:folate-binding protein YgfZ
MDAGAQSAAVILTVLEKAHTLAGAKMGTWFGCALPDAFGDWLQEYRFLRESVGLVDRSYRAYLDFSGPDRVRYLNAILTNNVKDLAQGRGVVSLLLSPQGKIQAEVETFARPESLFCVSFSMVRAKLIQELEHYIIMDDVTLTDRSEEFVTLGLIGPKAAEATAALTGVDSAAMAEFEFRDVVVGGVSCVLTKRLGGADFMIARGDAEKAWGLLLAETRKHGGGAAGLTALNALRLEQGVPWFGYDFGDKQIPHEAGLEKSHISYTKGCYTGQEIVERVRSRGQVNRVRVSLEFGGDAEPAAGAALLSEGKEVGTVTRTGYSPALKRNIGMGYLRREKSEPGTVVNLDDGAEVAVIVTPAEEKKTRG